TASARVERPPPLLLVPVTVRSPRRRIESIVFDRFAINETVAVGAVLYPLKCIADLTQYACAELRFGKVLGLPCVGHAVVGDISRHIDNLFARLFTLVRNPGYQLRFELKQSSLVPLNVHRCPRTRS